MLLQHSPQADPAGFYKNDFIPLPRQGHQTKQEGGMLIVIDPPVPEGVRMGQQSDPTPARTQTDERRFFGVSCFKMTLKFSFSNVKSDLMAKAGFEFLIAYSYHVQGSSGRGLLHDIHLEERQQWMQGLTHHPTTTATLPPIIPVLLPAFRQINQVAPAPGPVDEAFGHGFRKDGISGNYQDGFPVRQIQHAALLDDGITIHFQQPGGRQPGIPPGLAKMAQFLFPIFPMAFATS